MIPPKNQTKIQRFIVFSKVKTTLAQLQKGTVVMKKLIGVMPLWDDEKNSIWMLPDYLDGLHAVGLDTFVFPLSDDAEELERLTNLCDGILLTGGHDVNPATYGAKPLNETVVWNDLRDRMDFKVISSAISQNKAILGICRGIQILNVALGGTLYQDLPTEHPSEIDHHMHAPYDKRCHEVSVVKGSPLDRLLHKEKLVANSIHHQAVKDLAPQLKAMAFSTDGLIEAVCLPARKFVWGVQWHPEYWFRTNEDCLKIFQSFAENC